ncbi:MAG: phosphoribosylformylglycinamidine synthase I [Myxococcota bacterium]
MKPPVLILHAPGTNRDPDAALACELAGGAPEIVHIKQLLDGHRSLDEFAMLVFPGGFSFGDDLGAGTVWSTLMRAELGDALQQFVDKGRPVLGICNGFQALVKLGLLPGPSFDSGCAAARPVTLTRNQSATFECRWVTLEPNPDSPCVFTAGLTEPIDCPVAHGEGRFATFSDDVLARVEAQALPALRYSSSEYPLNPNGSLGNIAGLTNPAGNVLGLMPHPENHINPRQYPRWHRGERGRSGLPLFQRGVAYAASL